MKKLNEFLALIIAYIISSLILCAVLPFKIAFVVNFIWAGIIAWNWSKWWKKITN